MTYRSLLVFSIALALALGLAPAVGRTTDDNVVSGDAATVAGGRGNTASGLVATVGGGGGNSAAAPAATVAGGGGNSAVGEAATVSGGGGNTASGEAATVAGGGGNTASGEGATIAGGGGNTASGEAATVSGGGGNTASGEAATVPGGEDNAARGDYSLAAGRRAHADHAGAFVWADATDLDYASSAPNQFSIRATGGLAAAAVQLTTAVDATGGPLAGVRLLGGSSTWDTLSSRDAKSDFAPVDGRQVLERLAMLPIESWSYQAEGPTIRHVGPMAQDFAAAFGLGADDRYISAVDADGVALAAIQGLHQLVQDQRARIAALEARLAALEASLPAGPADSRVGR